MECLKLCHCQHVDVRISVCERFSLTGAFSLKLSFLVGITESEFLLFLPLAVRWDVHSCLTWWLWIKRLFCLTAFMVCELQDYSWDNLSIFYICSFCHGGLKPQTVFSPSKLRLNVWRKASRMFGGHDKAVGFGFLLSAINVGFKARPAPTYRLMIWLMRLLNLQRH